MKFQLTCINGEHNFYTHNIATFTREEYKQLITVAKLQARHYKRGICIYDYENPLFVAYVSSHGSISIVTPCKAGHAYKWLCSEYRYYISLGKKELAHKKYLEAKSLVYNPIKK